MDRNHVPYKYLFKKRSKGYIHIIQISIPSSLGTFIKNQCYAWPKAFSVPKYG